MFGHTINIVGSTLASIVCDWRGTSASRKVNLPEKAIRLYDREGCPECRFVREALTELNLDADIVPCPEGGQRFVGELKALSGDTKVPFMVDENTGTQLGGAQQIISYLFQEYRGVPVPSKLEINKTNLFKSKLASSIRHNAGIKAKASKKPEQPLVLYSFESSPFSRPVRELLTELEIPYHLVTLGKQQKADMGPAKFRFHLGPYKPLPNTKRAAFLAAHGDVQVPYLEDPNTNTQMFESADILKYLENTYAL